MPKTLTITVENIGDREFQQLWDITRQTAPMSIQMTPMESHPTQVTLDFALLIQGRSKVPMTELITLAATLAIMQAYIKSQQG